MPELKVLVALDGSTLSEASLRYLPLLKPLGDLRVSLLAVAETYVEAERPKGIDEHLEREARLLGAYLDKTGEQLRRAQGLQVETTRLTGNPDEEIPRAAKEFDADLVVITTHGRSGLGRWAIGSVADKVLQNADRPVLVVGPAAGKREAPGPIKRILVPLDGSDRAEAALEKAEEWALRLGAAVHLVRAVTLAPVTAESTISPDLFEAMVDAARIYLERAKVRLEGLEVATAAPVGPIADQLIEYAAANGIDLVIMTSHGRRGLLRSVLGSVTDRVLHGPAPVLVIRAG